MLLVTNINLDKAINSLLASIALMLVFLLCIAIIAQVAVFARLENYASRFFLTFSACVTFDVNFINTITSDRRSIRQLIFLILSSKSCSNNSCHTMVNADNNSFDCPQCSFHHIEGNYSTEKDTASTPELLPAQMIDEFRDPALHESDRFSNFPSILETIIICKSK